MVGIFQGKLGHLRQCTVNSRHFHVGTKLLGHNRMNWAFKQRFYSILNLKRTITNLRQTEANWGKLRQTGTFETVYCWFGTCLCQYKILGTQLDYLGLKISVFIHFDSCLEPLPCLGKLRQTGTFETVYRQFETFSCWYKIVGTQFHQLSL